MPGETMNSVERVECAIELDSCDEDAKKLLDKWRTKPPRAAQGGQR